jgi:hypothetical protein
MFCFPFCMFCVFILFCPLFLLMYTVVYFLFVYNFTDHCHRVETKLQLINLSYIISDGFWKFPPLLQANSVSESSWNVVAHRNAWEEKWRGNWRMVWVASTLHTTSEHGVCSITTADARTSAASSRLNWRPRWFKWTRPFHRKKKSGFCACAITFRTQSRELCELGKCSFIAVLLSK